MSLSLSSSFNPELANNEDPSSAVRSPENGYLFSPPSFSWEWKFPLLSVAGELGPSFAGAPLPSPLFRDQQKPPFRRDLTGSRTPRVSFYSVLGKAFFPSSRPTTIYALSRGSYLFSSQNSKTLTLLPRSSIVTLSPH